MSFRERHVARIQDCVEIAREIKLFFLITGKYSISMNLIKHISPLLQFKTNIDSLNHHLKSSHANEHFSIYILRSYKLNNTPEYVLF